MMIERVFIMSLLMSISGFVFCAIFIPFEKFACKLIPSRTMVSINTLAVLSFVIPLYFIISIKDGSEYALTHYNLLVYQDVGGYDNFVCNVREHVNVRYLKMIWFVGALILLFYYLLKYLCLLHKVRKEAFCICDDFWSVKFHEIKNQKHISNVYLVGCCSISTPCTVGVRNRYIVIPSYMINAFDEEEIEFILDHEFYHVVNDDLLRKLFIMILSCLCWFNPLYYLLWKNISEWAEIVCDGEVTKNYSKEQRRRYCRLILKVLEFGDNKSIKEIFIVRFDGLYVKNYQRRLMKIMKQNKTSSMIGRITVISVLLTAMFCSTVVAKEADMPVHMLFSRNVDMVNSSEIDVIDSDEMQMKEDFQGITVQNMGDFKETVLVNTQDITYMIIDSQKEISALEQLENQIELTHEHNLVDVTIEEHKKNKDGSCVTKYYKGQKCTVCGKLLKGSLIRTITDVECTH